MSAAKYNPIGFDNEEEKNALRAKMDNPLKDVTCPRCGKLLKYEEYGNSIIVECPTEGCIHGAIRGV